ncbi:MAG: hypothetical protein IPN68_06555 [Bacteroidetes bacterium]|nr:hypothetical protein [Bacteroidota bacterium]
MKRILFAATILILIISQPVCSQEISFPELNGYRKNTSFPVYTKDNLTEFNSNFSEVCLSYGFINLNIAEYRKGKNEIRIEIYQHSENLFAFGMYSLDRSGSYRFLNLGSQGYTTNESLAFFKGHYYVRIRTLPGNEKNLQMSESLALRVANMLPGNPEMPSALSRFPETGRKINEEIYINENVLGHKFLSGAFKAVYEVGPDNFSVYLFEKQSPSDTWKMAEAYLNQSGEDASESETGKYVISDGYNGTIFLAWAGKIMVIISGLSKDQADVADLYASEILGQ